MKKVNNKRFLFLVSASFLTLLSFANSSFAARQYFSDYEHGGMDTYPTDDKCLPAINKCLATVCKENDMSRAQLNGLYSRCDRYQPSDIYGKIDSCLSGASVQDRIKYVPYCSKFIVAKTQEFLTNKNKINDSASENSYACQQAKIQEMASATCFNFIYTQTAPFAGSVLSRLQSFCGNGVAGGSNNMAQEYFLAGNYSAVEAFERGLPANSKRDNWKDAARAVATSYETKKINACSSSKTEYDMPKVLGSYQN